MFNDKPQPLDMGYREFSLDDAPAPEEKSYRKQVVDPLGFLTPSDDEFTQEDIDAEEAAYLELAQENTRRAARQMLPRRPDIKRAIDEAMPLEMGAVVSAGFIETCFRDTLSDEEVDQMETALLIAETDNREELLERFAAGVGAVMQDYLLLIFEKDDETLIKYLEYVSPAARRMFFSDIAANLSIDRIEMETDGVKPQTDLKHMAGFIVETASAGEPLDQPLAEVVVDAFNKLSHDAGSKIRLQLLDDGAIAAVQPKPLPPGPTRKPPKL